MNTNNRNWNAVSAHFRNSAGPMRDRRIRRHDSRPNSRDLLEEFSEELYVCDFCNQETYAVRRIVLDKDYDRMHSEAKYACPDCFDQKEKGRLDVRLD